jgi:DNA-binding NarL/FixJ family response regulator
MKTMIGPLTLVIVDGHERARSALVRRLQRMPNVRVLAAVDDVGLAVTLIGELGPDVVLLEPKTVEERSPTAVSRLADTGRPIVVLTSSLVEGEAKNLIKAGASAVLLKDTDFQGLIHIISATIYAA